MKKRGFLGLIIAIIVIIIILLASLFFIYYPNNKIIEPSITYENLPEYEILTIDSSEIENINSKLIEQDFQVNPILINNLEITPNKQEMQLLERSKQQYFILQLIGPVKQEWKQILETVNVKFFDYIPEFSYKVKVHPKQIPEILKLKFVANIVEYKPELKIPTQTQQTIEESKDKEVINLYIQTFEESAALQSLLDQVAESYYKESPLIYHVKVKKAYIHYITNINQVEIIEELQPLTITNDYSSDIVEVDPTASILNLDGSGQIVGIIDSGVDTGVDANTEGDIHLDLDNRINSIYTISNVVCIIYGKSCTSADDLNGHGTHTSGSILGNGSASNSQYRGTAYNANLSFYAAGDDDGSRSIYIASLDSTMIQTSYDDGARIHSDSWGSSTTEYSTGLAKRMDSFMWDNKDILIVTSAGNDGSSLQTVRDPGTAKNVLTVGASQSNRSGSGYGTNINSLPSFSSRGPANDNRTKPDVVAPGTNIISTRSSKLSGGTQSCNGALAGNNNYSTCSGTSMSAPLTAGYVALVRENFIENINYQTPRSSLIKAMIINGAQDIGYGIPSNHSGWGRINLTNTLTPPYPKFFKYIDNTTGFSGSNQYTTHNIEIINTSSELKFTLVWTDYESTSSAAKNLVNDIDLIITSPNGSVYYGNNFEWPYNISQDRLNNVEQLILNSTNGEIETGTYTINISAFSISNTNQDYSIIISGGVNVSPTTSKFDGVTTLPNSGSRYYSESGFILENTTNGKIIWNENVYLSDMNFDDNIIMNSNNIWVNTTGLHSTLTTTNMTISLYNLSYEKPMPMKNGNTCNDCQLVSSTSGKVEFNATEFSSSGSNYSAVENSSIDIWDMRDNGKPYATDTIKYQNNEIYFYANYTNFSSSLAITTGTCTINYNDSTTATMNYNASINLYQYNRTFSNPTQTDYNISCSDTNFYQRNSTNSTTINNINAVYPWQPTNVSIQLNSNGTITINWNTTKDAGSYGLFYDSNLTKLWEFNDSSGPNITDINILELSYTDNINGTTKDSNGVTQRYYKVVALNSTSRTNTSNSTIGVLKKEIPVTTGNPNTGVELVIISIPLNVTDLSLSTLISTTSNIASNNDVIYTYNSTSSQPESVQFFTDFGWFGDFTSFNINQAYLFKPVTTAYNITFVGSVPITNTSFTIKQSTNIAGNSTELNLIGLNTPQKKCSLDTIFYDATNGDTIYRYNTATASYETVSFDGSNWSGDFDCINPGEGYEFRIVGSEYSINYER
ncbi:S8 family serine peptidase [Candidatus Woesearchaeota archaeon]|nr:S8 family serine peptidase [Candidatus Woesearchaeota archaeon]